jgi:ATP-binding protein involved in chromosome partitioning
MNVPIIGLIENMATYVCPHCDKEGKLFAGEDVHKLTERKEIPYIGKIPFDTRVSQTSGSLFYNEFKDSVTGQAIAAAVDNIEKFITK